MTDSPHYRRSMTSEEDADIDAAVEAFPFLRGVSRKVLMSAVRRWAHDPADWRCVKTVAGGPIDSRAVCYQCRPDHHLPTTDENDPHPPSTERES